MNCITPIDTMSSHTSGTSTNDGSIEVLNIEETECVPMNGSPIDVDCNASDIEMETTSSKLLSSDRHGSTDGAIHFSRQMAVNEKPKYDTDDVLTPSSENNPSIVEISSMPKLQIWKNLCILCTSFFLVFTSFLSLSNLQSSINKAEGMGTFSLVIIYIAMVFSSMFLSSIFMDRLGLKLIMCLSMITYVIYMAANLYPVWGIMVPAALLCGLAAGPLWASQSSYLSQLSRCYAKTTNTKPKDSLSYFFGIFYMCLHAGKISGNLLVSIVLKQDQQTNASMTLTEIEDCVANKQGAVDNATTLDRPDDTTIYSICGTWIGLAIVGIIVLAFLTSISVDMSKERKRKTIFSKCLSTAKHFWKSRLQKLLTPLTLYYGLSTGFLTVDFTKSVVGCTFGIHTVGDVMLCHGICNTVSSALIGRLVKNFGQMAFFTITFLCYGGVQVLLIVWKPGPDYGYLFFILAGIWGVADAILKTQVLALYGHLFVENTEAAFGNYFVFEATGFIISFTYSTFVSTDIKLYILLGMLVCSAASYYTVEYIDMKHNTHQDAGTDSITDS